MPFIHLCCSTTDCLCVLNTQCTLHCFNVISLHASLNLLVLSCVIESLCTISFLYQQDTSTKPDRSYSHIYVLIQWYIYLSLLFFLWLPLEKYEDLYAYQFKPNLDGFSQSRGWNLYDPSMEYGRMGVGEGNWKRCDLNSEYEVKMRYTCTCLVPYAMQTSTCLMTCMKSNPVNTGTCS